MMPECCLDPSECPAYILSGGQSSRFGSDKALVAIENQPQLLRLQRALQSCGHVTHVVADRHDRYMKLGVHCLVDLEPDCGPLAGLTTALQHRLGTWGQGWLLLVSCDQVKWLAEWWTQLSTAIDANTRAVTFAHVDSCAEARQATRAQPIPGLYHTLIADTVAQSLAARQLSLQPLLRQIPSVAVTTENNPRLWSFNCPDELAALQQRLMDSK